MNLTRGIVILALGIGSSLWGMEANSFYCYNDHQVIRYHTTNETGAPSFSVETPRGEVTFEIIGDVIRRESGYLGAVVFVASPPAVERAGNTVGVILSPVEIGSPGDAVDFDTIAIVTTEKPHPVFGQSGPLQLSSYEKVRCHAQHLYW